MGAFWTLALVLIGLWGWQRAESVVTLMGWEKRMIGAWSVRCMAAGLVAAGQAVLLALVVERVYRPDNLCRVARLSALFVFMVCTVSAIALCFAGR
jgi:hypothetical protein